MTTHGSGWRGPSRLTAAVLAAALSSCGGGSPTGPDGDDGSPLAAVPVLVTPVAGTHVLTDTPTFTVRNALQFDVSAATYTFTLSSASGAREIASLSVPAGRRRTSAVFPDPLPRGMVLTWRVSARLGGAETRSVAASFRSAAVACLAARNGYAQAVLDVALPVCQRMPNVYNDPQDVLGPPDAAGFGPFNYSGFLSLGERGHVTVDMEACAVDGVGADLRVFQAAGSEPVTVYAGGAPNGPFLLLEARKPCGTRMPGSQLIRYCEFDLATAEIAEARYFRIEDGEHYACALAETPSEGADIDAVLALNHTP